MRRARHRTALLTGASRGIGPYIARALAQEGMDVTLTARSQPDLERLAEELLREGVRARAIRADLSELSALPALVSAAEAELGPLDVLVNNAATAPEAPFYRAGTAEITSVLRVNLLAPLLLCRLVLPGMLARGRGHIVNVASLTGKVGLAHVEHYSAAKGGLIAFTSGLRAACRGTGVGVSAVCPGFVAGVGMVERWRRDTGWPLPRLLGTTTPQAVARAVVRAIQHDLPEVLVAPGPMRLLLAIRELFPSLVEWAGPHLGLDVFRRAEEAQRNRG